MSMTELDQLKAQLEAHQAALRKAKEALELWVSYFRTEEKGPLTDPEQAGEDFTHAWFETEDCLSTISLLIK